MYIGNELIVHRDGDGYLAKVGMQEFLERLGGFNPAITIFVSCHEGKSVGGEAIARRARWARYLREPNGESKTAPLPSRQIGD